MSKPAYPADPVRERRSTRYNTGLWPFVAAFLVCRYGGSKLCILFLLPPFCMRVSFRFFPPSFFFFIWFQWVLSFFFWDLIENLENQVNSLGDSRQCSVLYVRLNCLEPHTSTHTRSPDKIDLSWRYILVYGFRWSWGSSS